MPRSETYLALLSLFPATPEQTIASRKRTFHQWGGGMTEAVYLKRDEIMDVLEHAADGKLLTWLVVISLLKSLWSLMNDPQTLDFMCSCET
ncbi:hypothetical protein BJ138DRAFT_1143545 [Hygrophoropsis aurantiaca]|uniref:Uncharacterized protein n=1 Tax=Hygrophoropsis aurantiaca TaxID=72124 RepID=A0ACB8ANW9_9AGAM|nr:hypothetical protein BJ138DRAFT_1143545 [Hygrophoropsis aurantiaca]